MDTTVTIVFVIVLFALIIVASFFVFRQRSKVKVKGPLGTGLELDASNDLPPSRPGIEATNIKSRTGDMVADDQTGHGVKTTDVDVEDDVLLSSSDPKANPLA
ncbi:MAG: hypothetical protein GY934_03645 [Gammaproteobacteria bacterium]|nr:hypothetical protein [Gammaproteobacteria bacterium]